jgi:hypothetical protein
MKQFGGKTLNSGAVDGEICPGIGDWGVDTPWIVVAGTWCITYWAKIGDFSVKVLNSWGSSLTLNNWKACVLGSCMHL